MPRVGLRNSLRAFTLIELAIVLAVIGLIIGGVVSGKSLMDASRLRLMVSEFASYRQMLNTFYMTYDGALPGDMSNASSFWSTATNGNGSRSIETAAEQAAFFLHLSYAGILTQAVNIPCNGSMADSPPTAFPNDACLNPRSASTGGPTFAGFSAAAPPNTKFDFFIYNARNSNIGVLAPIEGYKFDTKIDEGRTDAGYIRAVNGTLGTCVDSGYMYYRNSSNGPKVDCRMVEIF